ncbi:hypothetical protein EHM69_02765, partial [candidate division KSB1 bacterium]
MKNTLLGLALALLLIPCLALAASDSGPVMKAQGTVPPIELKSSYNDGWVDVFPVPMDQNGEFRDLRGRSTLDVFDSTHYFEDFEGDCTAWTPEDLTVDAEPIAYWHIDDTLAIGGAAWYCADTTLALGAPYGGGYEDHKLMYLISDTLDLTSAATPVNLAFQARWSMEDPDTNTAGGCLYNLWDSWNVWASTDNGATWAVIQPTAPAYTNTSSFSFGYEWEMGCNIPAYGGTQADYVTCTFNLNSLVGNSQVLIRWAFASDPGYNSADDP